jgi:hypothetical protein
MLVGRDSFSDDISYIYQYCRLDRFPIEAGRLPLRLVDHIRSVVRELRPPILVGIVPLREYMPPRLRYCRFDRIPIEAGRLPLRHVYRNCRYVSELSPHMEAGSVPASAIRATSRCSSLERRPTADGKEPDNELR